MDLESTVETMVKETTALAKVQKKHAQELLKDNPPKLWRRFVSDEIRGRLDDEHQGLTDQVRAILSKRMRNGKHEGEWAERSDADGGDRD